MKLIEITPLMLHHLSSFVIIHSQIEKVIFISFIMIVFEQYVIDALNKVSHFDKNDIINSIIEMKYLPSYDISVINTFEVPDKIQFGKPVSEIETIQDCIEVMNESKKVSGKDTKKAISILVNNLIPSHAYSSIESNSENIKSVLADLYYYFIVNGAKHNTTNQNYRDESIMACIDLTDLYTIIINENGYSNATENEIAVTIHSEETDLTWMIFEIKRLCKLIKTANEEWH